MDRPEEEAHGRSDRPSRNGEPPTTGRRRLDPKQVAVWTAVSLVAAVAWGVLALARGEQVSAVWLVAAAVGSYLIGYRFYARFITRRVLKVDDTRATPAERLDNAKDFTRPTGAFLRPSLRRHRRRRAARRPRAGRPNGLPTGNDLDRRRRRLRRGRAGHGHALLLDAPQRQEPGPDGRDEIGVVGGVAALVAVFSIMIILLAVLALVVVNALAGSPWGTFSSP